jgi:hypothetical protein
MANRGYLAGEVVPCWRVNNPSSRIGHCSRRHRFYVAIAKGYVGLVRELSPAEIPCIGGYGEGQQLDLVLLADTVSGIAPVDLVLNPVSAAPEFAIELVITADKQCDRRWLRHGRCRSYGV